MTQYLPGMPLHLSITAVAYGGKGIARGQTQDQSRDQTGSTGKTWFVEGAVTGDVIEAECLKDEGRYGEAKIVNFVTKSPLRRQPVCAFEEHCGGCQWQQIPYDQQLIWKKSFVESALRRIGKLLDEVNLTVLPSPNELAYRNRILLRLHFDPGAQSERIKFGFFARGSRRLVAIDRCVIAKDSINQFLRHLKAIQPASLAPFTLRLEIQELPNASADLTDDQPNICVTVYRGEGDPSDILDIVNRIRQIPRVIWADQVFALKDAPLLPFDTDHQLRFFTMPGQFQQVNVEHNHNLRKLVLDICQKKSPHTILDLFCGSGNLSLALANGVRDIYGIEFNKQSIFCAKHNAEVNKLTKIQFFAGDAEKHLWKCARNSEKFDMVILDPPRQGLFKGMVPLKKIAPQTIIYVSCDPTTLARDLAFLCRNDDYKIESVTGLDFFPQTYHIETLTVLERAANFFGLPED